MGLIGLAAVYLDSCFFVIAFESRGEGSASARRLIEELRARPGKAATSELTIAEILAPTKRDQVMSVNERRGVYLGLFENAYIELAPITREVLLDTVELRETYPQRIADAIHISTAMRLKSRFFVSFDRDARRMPPSLSWTTPTEDEVDHLIKLLDA